MPRLVALALTLPLALAAAPSRAADAPLPALLAESDAAHARRDEQGALEEEEARLAEAERLAPDDFEVLWRKARLELWQADAPGLSTREKSRLGKLAWEHGERAARAAPDRVEGWHYAAAGMGNYALGIGILQAMHEGIEGRFKQLLSRAEQLQPGFERGAIQTAWGRFWSMLPWPKYDARKAERSLRAALEQNPDNVRAHVYLAELYRREGHGDRAREELERALANPPGRYDGPEERRMQAVARSELDRE